MNTPPPKPIHYKDFKSVWNQLEHTRPDITVHDALVWVRDGSAKREAQDPHKEKTS